MSDSTGLYAPALLEHDARPHHAEVLADPTHCAEGDNPLCGDCLHLQLRLERGVVAAIGCQTRGCAISRAAGSAMADCVLGRSVAELRTLSQAFQKAAEGGKRDAESPSELFRSDVFTALLEVRRYPARRRCATLCWQTLDRALAVQAARD